MYELRGVELLFLNVSAEGSTSDELWTNKIERLGNLLTALQAFSNGLRIDGQNVTMISEDLIRNLREAEAACFSAFGDDRTGLLASIEYHRTEERFPETRKTYFIDYTRSLRQVRSSIELLKTDMVGMRKAPDMLDSFHEDICQLTGLILQKPKRHVTQEYVYYSENAFNAWKDCCEDRFALINTREIETHLNNVILDPATGIPQHYDRWAIDTAHSERMSSFKKAMLIQFIAQRAITDNNAVLLKLLFEKPRICQSQSIANKWEEILALSHEKLDKQTGECLASGITDIVYNFRTLGVEVNPDVNDGVFTVQGIDQLVKNEAKWAVAQYAALSSEGYDDLLDEDNTEDAYVLRQSLKGMGERLVNVINTGLPDPALDLQTQVTYQMLCAMNHPTQYKMSEPERKHLAAAQLMLSIIKPQEAENAPNIRIESYKQSLRKPLLMTMSAHCLSGNQAVDDGKMTPFHKVMLDFHAIMKSSSKSLADPSNRWWIETSTPCGRFTSYHASKKLFYAINALNTKEGQVNATSELNQLITYYRNWSNLPQIKKAVVSSFWLGKNIRRKLTDLRNILEGESTYKKKSSGFGVMDIREAKMFLKIFPDLLNRIRPDQGQVEQHLQCFDEEQNRRMHPKTSDQMQNLMKALLPSQIVMVNLFMQLRMQEVRENNRLDEAMQEIMQNNVQPLEAAVEQKNQEIEQLRRQLAQTPSGNGRRDPRLFQENAPVRGEGVVNLGDVQVEHADAALVRN